MQPASNWKRGRLVGDQQAPAEKQPRGRHAHDTAMLTTTRLPIRRTPVIRRPSWPPSITGRSARRPRPRETADRLAEQIPAAPPRQPDRRGRPVDTERRNTTLIIRLIKQPGPQPKSILDRSSQDEGRCSN